MARYTPAIVNNPPVDNELGKIAQALDTADAQLNLDMLYAPPKKYREGTIVLADGTSWSPSGLGRGFYGYYSGAWNKLG